jgi:alcohol dehydrogenase
MKHFELILPNKIIFGKDTINKLAKEVKVFGKKGLIILGRKATKKLLNPIVQQLNEEGIEMVSYEGISPEPTLEVLEKVRDFAKDKNIDFVIGLGGGSVLDVAKAVAGLYYEKGKAWEYQEGGKIKTIGLPYIAIPTVSGTGAEATYNAVIINDKENTKKSIRHKSFMARLVIIDPNLVLEVPAEQTAISGMDALIHGIEAFTSINSNPITDTLALFSIKLIANNLKHAVDDGYNIQTRENVAIGSLLAGIALANAGLGAIHGLASPIGALYRVPHGLVCAVLAPYVIEYNLDSCIHKYADIAKVLTGQQEGDARSLAFSTITTIDKLLTEVKLPKYLDELGIREEDIDFIVTNASSSIKYNPKKVNMKELKNLLRQALRREVIRWRE